MTKAFTYNHNPVLQLDLPVWRAYFVLLCLLAGALLLLGRSFYLQTVDDEDTRKLRQHGRLVYVRVLDMPVDRGRITDRHGTVLALSVPVKSIWVKPRVIKERGMTVAPLVTGTCSGVMNGAGAIVQGGIAGASIGMADLLEHASPAKWRQLAQLLGMTVAEINELITPRLEQKPTYLARQISPEIAEQVMALELPGIDQEDGYRRFYPKNELVSHIIGYTDMAERGRAGIEQAYEELLAGRAGERWVIRDGRKQIVEEVDPMPRGGQQEAAPRVPRNGQDVVLSIDAKLQRLAYSALHEAMHTHRAQAGSIVVIDVQTGEILALVNAPTFNPNNRASFAPEDEMMRNRAFSAAFEPGSVMKPFAVAHALASGRFTAGTRIDTSPGSMYVDGEKISDSSPHGILTVAEVVQKSSNIGTAKMALQFSAAEMWKLYSDLGFGSKLNISGFPGEASGKLRPARGTRPIEQATMSYGHGISVTFIQIARAYLAFARDGELLPLSLVKLDKPPVPTRVFSPEVAREMRKILESVVAPGGTGTRARVEGYRVAGKTGTANKIENGVYTKKYISSFIGFAPVSNPRLIVAVMIDEPSEGGYGGVVAAPVFAKVIEGSLRTLGVATDAPVAPLQLTALRAEGRR
ncbi:MAG: penicillin-binding protein 2 [Azoarcus sp.]|jgi:cell division protein FtsI (penicillin-binding protein 3)|nr:penicillin-binding protein 2 [Azoarcus sp.]